MTGERIAERLKDNGIQCDGDLPEKLSVYLRLLGEWNQKMDLTAVEGEEELLDKHFIDSLTVMKTGLLADNGTLIDVGTGAGFPGMVLAMAVNGLKVTLLDSQKKRLFFLQAVSDELGIKNVQIIHARAEDAARNPEFRGQFDVAVARALAPLNVLCEYLLPFVHVSGRMLCWKGPALREEMEAGRRAAFLLGGRIGEPVFCKVEGRDWDHLILPVEKTSATPGIYPRKAGIPKQSPLGA